MEVIEEERIRDPRFVLQAGSLPAFPEVTYLRLPRHSSPRCAALRVQFCGVVEPSQQCAVGRHRSLGDLLGPCVSCLAVLARGGGFGTGGVLVANGGRVYLRTGSMNIDFGASGGDCFGVICNLGRVGRTGGGGDEKQRVLFVSDGNGGC